MPLLFSAAGGVLSAQRTLVDADIKTLNTLPVSLVPAPGAGLLLVPLMLMMFGHVVTGYTGGGGALSVRYTGRDDVGDLLRSSHFFLDTDGRDDIWIIPPLLETGTILTGPPPAVITNTGLVCEDASGPDYAGGDAANTLTVWLYYTVVAVPA